MTIYGLKFAIYRIDQTISIKIEPVNVCRIKVFEAIRRDESADFGIVVAAVQVIEPGLRIVVVPAVTERVDIQDFRADLRQKITPSVIFVQPEQVPAGIIDADDIALQVLAVEVLLSVVLKSGYARVIIVIMNDRVAALFRKDQIALDKVLRRPLLDSDACIVVGKRKIAVLGQIAAAPGKQTVAVGRGIARAIVNDARPVVESQPIAPRPACILIAVRCLDRAERSRRIGILFFARQVACAVVVIFDELSNQVQHKERFSMNKSCGVW